MPHPNVRSSAPFVDGCFSIRYQGTFCDTGVVYITVDSTHPLSACERGIWSTLGISTDKQGRTIDLLLFAKKKTK